ncbi:PIR Superfamily Protein [Plasmodium ovale wallikeri]|uniref:PIR Superfamily Protein n=1 Tax=Plasmodium ovale wallikeri TaxID=864142 RepID=A0A1A9AFS6_PLAOA|nr:PIR Superfamily Protein [Plasmodium ovale wallikeri]SBT56824.1 PIR Superfamily Protein [Plasmodium ovale wallikeri]
MSTTDYSLSILSSNIFYNRLDTASHDYSDKEKSFWNNYIKTSYIKETGISDNILKAFYYVSYLNAKDTFYNERWNYLYFWVGFKVLEKLGNVAFTKVIPIIKNVKEHIHGPKYEYDILKIGSDKFKDLKTIYDYFENYNSINLKIGGNNPDCTQMYKQYVDSSYAVYENIKNACLHNGEEEYCKLFNYIVNKHNNIVLEKLTCNGNKPPLSVEEHKKIMALDTVEDVGLEQQVHEDGTSHSTSDNMMQTFFPILGIFSFLFLLYNFTPFRSWLDNILSKKEIIKHNLYEDESEELFESQNKSSYTDRHYNRNDINYHSIINS